ncbi:glycosyltransferase [Litoribacter ruber]|uniref:glycosyltransferase n=1 Tax=Litoribacter ruber TaxID=702568 RepID=UPI001BDAA7F6|nr:glycosyltransferase [Litoribacter ruber]MBT0811118.1 glycosyltransferase [Litoribacter ruber]
MIFQVLGLLFLTALLFQFIYLVCIYGRLAFFFRPVKENLNDANPEAVTMLIVARNEYQNLQKLIPELAKQDYPKFELMVVNDQSTDQTAELLEEFMEIYPNLRTVTVNYTPAHVTPKKYALTLGIKVAKHDVILLTDADCTPASKNWAKLMTAPVRLQNKTFAIGYGAYRKDKGFLNWLIQYETVFTALQYFSFGLWKSPYMAVGRNLCYRKSFFMEKKAFKNFWHILGGDDDLFVNQYANSSNTSMVIDPESITVSEPKRTFSSYNIQKKRHFQAGKYYKTLDKLKIGLFAFSHLLFWASGIALMAVSKDPMMIAGIGALFLIRTTIAYGVFRGAYRKLEGQTKVFWTIFFDLIYLGYFWVMGTKGYLSKTVRWK